MTETKRAVLADWMTIIQFSFWVVSLCFAAIGWYLTRPDTGLLTSSSGLPRLETILLIGAIGMVAGVANVLLWILAELIFGWHFGSGGGDSLPEGWSAVVLSTTITIPLALAPPLFAWLSHVQVTSYGHALASCFMVVSAAVGHLVLYGAKSMNLRGLRNTLFPLNSPPILWRALIMEMVYAVMHFSSIVLTYRIALELQFRPPNAISFFPVFRSECARTSIVGLLWFCGTSIFILLKFLADHDSLTDKRVAEVRGVISGLMLLLALEAGILM